MPACLPAGQMVEVESVVALYLCVCMCTQVVEAEGVAALFKGAAEQVLRSSPQFGAACMCSSVHAAWACSGAYVLCTCSIVLYYGQRACSSAGCKIEASPFLPRCPDTATVRGTFDHQVCNAVRFQRAEGSEGRVPRARLAVGSWLQDDSTLADGDG